MTSKWLDSHIFPSAISIEKHNDVAPKSNYLARTFSDASFSSIQQGGDKGNPLSKSNKIDQKNIIRVIRESRMNTYPNYFTELN